MIDRYTKAVLTVIAGALTALAWQGLAPAPARAFGECGGYGTPCQVELAASLCTINDPCFIDIPGLNGFPVRVVGN